MRRTADEPLFNSLMEQHHYLGYEQPVGEHLKYLVWAQGRPIACLAWSSAPRHLGSRDRYIGWSAEARRRNIRFIAYNTRFLILPWVQVPHLASHILGRMASAYCPATGSGCTAIRFTSRKPSSIPAVFAGPVTAPPTGCCWAAPRGAARTIQQLSPNRPIKEILGLAADAAFPRVAEPVMKMQTADRCESGRTGPDDRSRQSARR